MPNMLAAAKWYAARDIPVFPVVPRGKRPLTEHGFKDATTDTAQIEAWWTEHPDANIGAPTGVRFDVIDVDSAAGREVLAGMPEFPVIGRQSTARAEGGEHLLVPVTGHRSNTSNHFHAGLDFRGGGGYVVLAPSIGLRVKDHPEHGYQAYKWIDRPQFSGQQLDREHPIFAPFLAKQETSEGARSLIGVDITGYGVDHDARRELAACAWEMVTSEEGGRNHLLNALAYRIGRLVGAERLAEGEAFTTLERAATLAGLEEHEILATVRSGLQSGKKDPKPRDSDAAEGEEVGSSEITGAVDFYAEWDKSEDEIPWIIWPILAERRLTALYSVPKVGKSLVALDAAVKSSRGEPFLSHKPAREYVGLYLDCENDIRGDVIKRAKDMGYGPDAFDRLYYYSFHNLAPMDTEKGGRQVLELARLHGADFVIVDTVSRHVEGEENSNDTWLSWYNHTGKLLKGAGIAALRIDHAGKDEAKGQRGGSAKGGDIDMIWRLSLAREDLLSLKLDSARMHIPKDMHALSLARRDAPLRHEIVEMGEDELIDGEPFAAEIAHVETLGLKPDVGNRKLLEAVRSGGFSLASGRVAAFREAWEEAYTTGVIG